MAVLIGHLLGDRLAAQGGGTTPLPNPDVVDTTNMSGTAGKVALASSTTLITGLGDPSVVDFVGYGTTASAFEGAGPTPAPSNANAVFRKDAGCTDTDNNGIPNECEEFCPANFNKDGFTDLAMANFGEDTAATIGQGKGLSLSATARDAAGNASADSTPLRTVTFSSTECQCGGTR
jgi:hypothetical protein